MSENEDEYIITGTEDDDDDENKFEREILENIRKTMKEQAEQRRLGLLMSTLGMTKKICDEKRDASALFQRNDRRCELFGIRCAHPQCYICNLIMYYSRQKIGATLENIGKVYQVSTDWSYDEEEDGGEDSEHPAQDTEEL